MIIVTGSVLAKSDTLAEAQRISLEHVRRSRAEPGCISHAVHIDCENPLRLVFVEQWVDRAALAAHFAVLESGAMVRALGALAAEKPTLAIYDATKLGEAVSNLRMAALSRGTVIAMQHCDA